MANIRTTIKEDNDFMKEIVNSSALENAIDYIVDQFSVEEIYGKDIIEEWALDNGFRRESEVADEISMLEDKIEELKSEIEGLHQDLAGADL